VWACPRTPSSVVLCAFWAIDERSDEGEGGHRHTLTPSPRAAITIKSAQHTRSVIIHHIFLKSPGPSVFMRTLGERRAIRRGGGGTQAHINPLPPRWWTSGVATLPSCPSSSPHALQPRPTLTVIVFPVEDRLEVAVLVRHPVLIRPRHVGVTCCFPCPTLKSVWR
jgi:hypothetical protein